jgi:hypothetical protein
MAHPKEKLAGTCVFTDCIEGVCSTVLHESGLIHHVSPSSILTIQVHLVDLSKGGQNSIVRAISKSRHDVPKCCVFKGERNFHLL